MMAVSYVLAMSTIFMIPFDLTDMAPLLQSNITETTLTCGEVCLFDDWFQRARCEERGLHQVPLPSGCEGAIMLELHENSITHLDTESLSGFRYVRTLDISRNGISKLEPGSFVAMANLKNVLLSYNQLTDIQNGTFLGTENHLERLYLDENQISNVNELGFIGIGTLTTLNLRNNQLEFLPATLFHGLHNLQYLTLSMNRLTQIAKPTFCGLFNLKFLYLAHNKLSWLPKGLFTGLQSLTEVHLSHNSLGYIPSPENLGVHSTFQLLDLTDNNLTESGNILPYLQIAERCYIGANPYICDCDFQMLQQWYISDTERSNYVLNTQVTCQMDSLAFNIDDIIDVIDKTSCDTGSTTNYPLNMSTTSFMLKEVFKSKEDKSSLITQEKEILDAVTTSAFSTNGLSFLNNNHHLHKMSQFSDKIFGVSVYCAVTLTLLFVLWATKSIHSIVLENWKRGVG